MSPKPSPKSSARKASPAPKAAKKAPEEVHAAKPRPAPKAAVPPPAAAPKPTLVKERVRSKVESTPPAEFSSEVLEFITAVDAYKRLRGRPFPHLSEVFAIVKSLGYHKSA